MATNTPMSGDEYKSILRKLGMTHGGKSAVAFLGIELSTSYRYARIGPPKPIAMLLRLMVSIGLTPEAVEQAQPARRRA